MSYPRTSRCSHGVHHDNVCLECDHAYYEPAICKMPLPKADPRDSTIAQLRAEASALRKEVASLKRDLEFANTTGVNMNARICELLEESMALQAQLSTARDSLQAAQLAEAMLTDEVRGLKERLAAARVDQGRYLGLKAMLDDEQHSAFIERLLFEQEAEKWDAAIDAQLALAAPQEPREQTGGEE